jgi:hypothetical protein
MNPNFAEQLLLFLLMFLFVFYYFYFNLKTKYSELAQAAASMNCIQEMHSSNLGEGTVSTG